MSFPEGWKETILGDVVDIKGGKRLPKGESLVSTKTNHPYIRITDLDNNQIKINQLQFIEDTTFSKISRYIVNTNDIIISVVGTIGLIALIDERLNNANLTENCNKLVIKQPTTLDSQYLFYYLVSRAGQYEINKNTVGAVQKKLPIYGVSNITITLPPLQEQKAIANILSSFDEKIELLKEQNKTLEEMAQGVFREWFVDGVDESWEITTLGEVTNIKGGATPSTKNEDFWDGDIHWTSPKDLSNSKSTFLLDTSRKITEAGLKKISSGLLHKGTLLLSSRAPIGYLAISNVDIAINQGYIALLDNAYFSNYYMYFWLKTHMNLVEGASNGSTFQEISKSAFRQIECTVPSKDFLEKFDTFVKPTLDKILLNLEQIQTLQKTRDTLLAKLMNGEVRVAL